MPRTPHGVVDHEAVGEGPVIVRAVRAYGEDLPSSPREHHVVAAGLSEDHSSIGQFLQREAFSEVWLGVFLIVWMVSHELVKDAMKLPIQIDDHILMKMRML